MAYSGLAKFSWGLKQLPYLPTKGSSRNEASKPLNKQAA